MLVSLFTGCNGEKDINVKENNNKKAEVAENTAEGSHKIVDHAGHEVEVPNNIQRIVIDQIPILSTYAAYHGGKAPYIVGGMQVP